MLKKLHERRKLSLNFQSQSLTSNFHEDPEPLLTTNSSGNTSPLTKPYPAGTQPTKSHHGPWERPPADCRADLESSTFSHLSPGSLSTAHFLLPSFVQNRPSHKIPRRNAHKQHCRETVKGNKFSLLRSAADHGHDFGWLWSGIAS